MIPARPKVLYMITKSNWGGAQRYVYDLATHRPKDQFEVAVAVGGPGALTEKLTAAGIPVLFLDRVQRDLSLTRDIGGFASLYRTVRTYRPDVVHLNSSKVAGLGALAARLLGVRRIVFTVHGWPFMEHRSLLWRLFAFLGSYLSALLSHQVIVISTHDLRIGHRMPFLRKKLHLVYNGIELPMTFGSGSEIRAAFPPGVPITGTVGELTRNKNHKALIERARKEPTLYLAIVGEGEERGALEAAIARYKLADRVKLFGFIPAQDVLRGFDTFAFPSLKEGLPYVLLEARAAGLPIVASRVGGIPDVVDAPNLESFTLEHMLERTQALYTTT